MAWMYVHNMLKMLYSIIASSITMLFKIYLINFDSNNMEKNHHMALGFGNVHKMDSDMGC
jgi:hypothetical protein